MEIFYKFTLNIQKIQLKEWKKKVEATSKSLFALFVLNEEKVPDFRY